MRQNEKYIYTACFINRNELLSAMEANGLSGQHLDRIIDCPHVTLLFKPEDPMEAVFGEEVQVEVYAYGNDARNEGLAVNVVSDNVVINELLQNVQVPHITVSVAEDARPVDTATIKFERTASFILKGVYGGYPAS